MDANSNPDNNSLQSSTDIADYTWQPDAVTCQSAAIAKVLGKNSAGEVQEIRRDLLAIARPSGAMAGSTWVMGTYLKPRVKEYGFSDSASLVDIAEWAMQGPDYECIIHGVTTGLGHVWGIEDVATYTDTQISFVCDDPWAEFDFPGNRYLNKSGKNVVYSGLAIWAYCVVSYDNPTAARKYKTGMMSRLDRGAWVHFIRN